MFALAIHAIPARAISIARMAAELGIEDIDAFALIESLKLKGVAIGKVGEPSRFWLDGDVVDNCFLDELLKRQWTTEDGRRLRLGAVCIDSGGHHTQEVYRFCNTRLGRHIYAIKGMDGARPIWPRRAGREQEI